MPFLVLLLHLLCMHRVSAIFFNLSTYMENTGGKFNPPGGLDNHVYMYISTHLSYFGQTGKPSVGLKSIITCAANLK